jgi:hypothetical protein
LPPCRVKKSFATTTTQKTNSVFPFFFLNLAERCLLQILADKIVHKKEGKNCLQNENNERQYHALLTMLPVLQYNFLI